MVPPSATVADALNPPGLVGLLGDVLDAYIRAQRQLADLSLRQLAGPSNVSNAYLSQIKRGLRQPPLKVLRFIASAL